MEDIFKGRFELEDSRTIDSNESHPGKPGIEVKATLISNKLRLNATNPMIGCDLAEILYWLLLDSSASRPSSSTGFSGT